MRKFNKTKKRITILITLFLVWFLFFQKESLIHLPDLNDITSVALVHYSKDNLIDEQKIVESEKIKAIYACLEKAKKTKEESVSDFPMADECYEIRLVLNGKGFVKLYYYQEQNRYILERPFDFKYELPIAS